MSGNGDDSVATWTATRLAAAVAKSEIGSRELLDLYLDRIDRLDGDVNAVVTLDVDRARADAAEADDETASGLSRGPLHGLPITVKDAIETAGIRSTGGATALSDHVPTADAPAVAKLKAAGAIVFGKTNLPEWSGDLQAFNDIFGTTNNPWDRTRIPGGSSGGAAAAVACGFTSFELGTDIGGSVRLPSHCCGVFALKPSFGVVPQRGYLDHVGGGTTDADINVFGPITRGADDLELLLGVLAGPPPDEADAWRIDLPAPTARSVQDLRIGLWLDDPGCRIDHEYLSLLRAAADRLADVGAEVVDDHPAVDFAEQVKTFGDLIGPAISPSLPDDVADGLSGSHRAWLRARERRAALRARWAEWFAAHDILLCPVMPTPAFPHNQEGDFMSRTTTVNGETRPYYENTAWTGLIGVIGHPSAVVPAGFTADGIPVGLQVVAGYLRDRTAVQAAALISDVLGGYRPPPGF
jgi:amidase